MKFGLRFDSNMLEGAMFWLLSIAGLYALIYWLRLPEKPDIYSMIEEENRDYMSF